MSLELQEWKRFDKKNPAIKSQLTMAGQMVMGQSMTLEGGLESQTGKSNDMDPDKVAFELARISPVRLLRMEKNGYSASVLGQEPLRGEDCYVLEFAKGDDVETYWFQVNDGLMVQSRTTDFDGATMTMQHQTYMPFGNNGLKLAAITTTSMSGQSDHAPGTVEFNRTTDADFNSSHERPPPLVAQRTVQHREHMVLDDVVWSTKGSSLLIGRTGTGKSSCCARSMATWLWPLALALCVAPTLERSSQGTCTSSVASSGWCSKTLVCSKTAAWTTTCCSH